MGKRGMKPRPASERFHGKYAIDPETGCWNWTGYVAEHGYGTIGETVAPGRSRSLYAHRISYEIHKGPIPEGLVVDHMCNNRRCVNPDHLQAITHRENVLRSPHPLFARRRVGLCIRGHDMTDPTNVYIRPDNGRKMCKACTRIRQRERDRAAGIPEKSPPRCGTYSGSVAHARRKEPCCEACRSAATEYHRQRRARVRAAS